MKLVQCVADRVFSLGALYADILEMHFCREQVAFHDNTALYQTFHRFDLGFGCGFALFGYIQIGACSMHALIGL
ncbi:hypothetical protein GALL_534420 [mine drainage metagenome]|uniref:Uncharacterized protein n=1 Tax=mine drainage metagenome TaxID=410659 RepID=A0A1J5PBY6_9ZZZZ